MELFATVINKMEPVVLACLILIVVIQQVAIHFQGKLVESAEEKAAYFYHAYSKSKTELTRNTSSVEDEDDNTLS